MEVIGRVLGQERELGDGDRTGDDEEERGEDASGAPIVETGDAEMAGVQLFEDQAGDQLAADDKEDIHTNETATERRKTRVEEYDRQHRNRLKTVNLWTTSQLKPSQT